MEPDNETAASKTMPLDGRRRVAIAAQAFERRIQKPESVLEFAGSLDTPFPLEEADERHDVGRRSALAPAAKPDRRGQFGTTALVLQKALDNRAVDDLELDPGQLKPDQEVTGSVTVIGELTLSRSVRVAKIVDELKNDRVEAGQGCRPQQRPAVGCR